MKARKVRASHRHLRARLSDYHAGKISFAEFDASVKGWVNHVSQAETWGLRRRVLDSLVMEPPRDEKEVER
ncbi:MAG: hypothetical protein AAGA68_13255 [Pseudomonadota bacterium]